MQTFEQSILDSISNLVRRVRSLEMNEIPIDVFRCTYLCIGPSVPLDQIHVHSLNAAGDTVGWCIRISKAGITTYQRIGHYAKAASFATGVVINCNYSMHINLYNTSSFFQVVQGVADTDFDTASILFKVYGTGDTYTAANIYNPKVRLTPEGGIAVLCTAGEALALGEVVQITQGAGGADDKVYKNVIDGDMPVGVVYAAALINAAVWIVVAGICKVLPEAAWTATRGYVIYSSNATAGRVDEAAAIPAVAAHNREIGHWLYTGTGNGVATLAIIHWN